MKKFKASAEAYLLVAEAIYPAVVTQKTIPHLVDECPDYRPDEKRAIKRELDRIHETMKRRHDRLRDAHAAEWWSND